MSKIEKIRFSEEILSEKFYKKGRHPLESFVSASLIPEDVEIVFLDDLNDFHARLVDTVFGCFSQCYGCFVAPDHCWAADSYEKVKQGMKKDYDVEIDGPTILLPTTGNRQYWSMVHEGLHSVFHGLSEDDKQRIVESAITAFPTVTSFNRMLDLTHLNVSSFDYQQEADEQAAQLWIQKRGEEASAFYTLKNLRSKGQMKCVDEYIANFFANRRVGNRFDPVYLPPSLRSTLSDIGYNMSNPPEISD